MLYINGKWGTTEEQLEVINPSTGEVIDSVSKSGQFETISAVKAAKKNIQDWSKRTAKDRYDYLNRLAAILRKKTNKIAEVITNEMGKPLKESKGEIALAIDYLEWYAEEGRRVYGETIPASAQNKRLMVKRQPVGVVGAITPWNFPIAMVTRKV